MWVEQVEQARQKVTRRIAEVKSSMQQATVAGKMKVAAETLVSELKDFCNTRSLSRDDAFGDSATEPLGKKRKHIDEAGLNERFKALDELRREWKAATDVDESRPDKPSAA